MGPPLVRTEPSGAKHSTGKIIQEQGRPLFYIHYNISEINLAGLFNRLLIQTCACFSKHYIKTFGHGHNIIPGPMENTLPAGGEGKGLLNFLVTTVRCVSTTEHKSYGF